MARRHGGLGDRRGFALVVVIVILMLVSFLAYQLIAQVRSELQAATNARDTSESRLLAEGGVNIALFRLLDRPEPGSEPEWFGGAEFYLGRSYETILPVGKIEYYALNESGKINLNSSSHGLLSLFLQYQGLKPEEIAVVLDSLQDWRDADNLTRLNGAEQDYYQKLTPPYIPRNGNLEDPGEFFLLRGTESLRGRFDPDEVFTVCSTSGRLSFDSLPRPILDFLVMGNQAALEQYRQAKENGTKMTVELAQQILGVERFSQMRNYLLFGQRGSQFYSITARGWGGDGVPGQQPQPATGKGDRLRPGMEVAVRVRLEKNGFSYLSWREKYL